MKVVGFGAVMDSSIQKDVKHRRKTVHRAEKSLRKRVMKSRKNFKGSYLLS